MDLINSTLGDGSRSKDCFSNEFSNIRPFVSDFIFSEERALIGNLINPNVIKIININKIASEKTLMFFIFFILNYISK